MDEILTRPYDTETPMGCVGPRLWATSPQGWGFRNDVHWIFLTNFHAFEIEVNDEHGRLEPERATYFPSHIHMEGAKRMGAVASASFTFSPDNAQSPLGRPFLPEKRWTCWSSGKREDWYEVEFGSSKLLTGFRLFFFDDAPTGGCRPPDDVKIEKWMGGEVWSPMNILKQTPQKPGPNENVFSIEPIHASRVRFVFRNAGEKFYTGLYGFEPIESEETQGYAPVSVEIIADKFITNDDVLMTLMKFHNPSKTPIKVSLAVSAPQLVSRAKPALEMKEIAWPGWTGYRVASSVTLQGVEVACQMAHLHNWRLTNPNNPMIELEMKPGQSGEFRVALAMDIDPAAAERAMEKRLKDADPLAVQKTEYQLWFDDNLPYFDCSDPWITKMYYHRAYNLRKNSMDPKLGKMQSKAFSEGRWRSVWYPNVISYGGGHQIRESRWLRDKSWWEGQLRTFAENEKPDGVYPSHVRPEGQKGGQYTDWITSTAWDGYLVHPDKEFLASVADKLAVNTRGWQKVYDPDGDGLLFVDSHWWTGMEWQPSFFAPGDYKTDPKDRMQPLKRGKIDRVDLTAYNYGNASAVGKIYRELGKEDQAKEFEQLAEKIKSAMMEKMWDGPKRFFYSLDHEDHRKVPVKEVIGVYPFYFGMLPTGRGFEDAWASITDPNQFWTPWPVASASKECPAYSQDGWPTDKGGSGCMWNGPTWPHANSLVLTAMEQTLRAERDAKLTDPQYSRALTNEHFWKLFESFTRAQYKNQDLQYPWTGEFYNGETAKWKTNERDYNHSTWIDILITGVVGLVPRPDNTLEIDPLIPAGKLEHFLLDGLNYRGHDVTVVWDDPQGKKDHYGDGRRGLDVYIDGKLAKSSPKLERLTVDLKK